MAPGLASASIATNSRSTRTSIASLAITRTIRIRRGPGGPRSCRTTAGLIPATTRSRLSVAEKDRTVSNDQVLHTAEEVRRETRRIVSETAVFDMHTHLFPPAFGDLSRWGIDSLLTYHYLVAEVMRAADVRPADFQRLPQAAQADLIWDALFVRSTPLSEATRGVVAVMSAL